MVPRPVIFILGIFLVASSLRADLNLTPQVEDYELDGVKMRRLVFMDGSTRVTYTPPPGWEFSGSSSAFLLHPTKGGRGEASVTKSVLAQEEKFDDETINRLTQEVLQSAPNGATNVGLVSQEKNPMQIERKETLLVIIKYDQYGEPQLRSVMFLNRGREQIRFQLTAPKTNFTNLQEAFRSSHFSWQKL